MPLQRTMTFRYSVALGLVACVMVVAFIVLIGQIKNYEQDAYLINISGQQRMLSQRIAFLTNEIYHKDNGVNTAELARKLEARISRMMQNHEELTSGNLADGNSYTLSQPIREYYFGAINLDERVRAYTEKANEFLSLYKRGGDDAIATSPLRLEISRIARDDLLYDLNNVVTQYQLEAEDKIYVFKRTETAIVAFGLFMLILEVIFIFRPMVTNIVNNTRQLQKANAELTEFAYRISHDLRAPIVSSLGIMGMVEDDIKKSGNDTVIGAVEHIKASMTRLELLISDILSLTKTRMVDIEPEEVDVQAIIDDALEKVENLDSFEEISVKKNIQGDVAIVTKKILLQQIIGNLISNAVKYADMNKAGPYIDINFEKKNGVCHFSVRDNGLGIPKDYQEKVFGMFQRFHPKTAFGSGLGLYMTKQNAELLGGDVKYIPHEDGTEFLLTFPPKEAS